VVLPAGVATADEAA